MGRPGLKGGLSYDTNERSNPFLGVSCTEENGTSKERFKIWIKKLKYAIPAVSIRPNLLIEHQLCHL